MTTPEGAFCASLDADSEGEEGKFYVWSLAEIETSSGQDDAAFFARHYDVTPEGNFEGHNILNRLARVPRERRGRDAARRAARATLLAVREQRVRPGLDDKVLADWNGLMIAALANAGVAFGEPELARDGGARLHLHRRNMSRGDRLGHSWRAGKLLFPGLASDHANMIRAALALHEATGERRLSRARARLAGRARPPLRQSRDRRLFPHRRRRRGPGGAAERDHRRGDAQSRTRSRRRTSCGSRSCTGQDAWRAQADRLFDGVAPARGRQICSCISRCSTRSTCGCARAEIVVAGEGRARTRCSRLRSRCRSLDRIVLRAPSADGAAGRRIRRRRRSRRRPRAAAFICVGERCSLPVTEPDDIAEPSRRCAQRHVIRTIPGASLTERLTGANDSVMNCAKARPRTSRPGLPCVASCVR